jgi:DNA-binding NtrC family response regulator
VADILLGHLILLVEDEPLIALDIEDMLRRAGAQLVVAGDFDSAMQAAARDDVTVAVLDYRLGQQTSEPICEILNARRVPYVITTGDIGCGLPGKTALLKPVAEADLIAAVAGALSLPDS